MFTVFPADIKISNTKQTLIGGGLRSKWGFKVYSVGIYSDVKLLNKLIKKYRDTISKKDLITDFTESKFTKTLLLKFHREVAANDMSDALGQALISKVGKEKSNKFSAFLLGIVDGDRLTKGSDLYITCKGDKLLASISNSSGSGENGLSNNASSETSDVQKFDYAGKNVKGLCMAIFEAYLGDTPVSQQAKEGFEQGFSDMIARDELNMILQM